MPSFFASHGDQDSQPISIIDGTEYETTSESSLEPDNEKEETKEDILQSQQKLSPVITTNAKGTHKAKARKSSWWWKRSWKKKSKKKKRKRKRKWKWKQNHTMSMHRHHHATFAHLTHDALLRLKCSPVHHSGYTQLQIIKNIEKHYKLKLGKKFAVRLQLCLERLVRKGLLVPVGNLGKYKPSEEFVAQFSRLKVIDGASNSRFGLIIHKYRSTSRSRSRSLKRRRGRRKKKRRKRRKKRRRRKHRHELHHHHQSKRKQHSNKSNVNNFISKKTESQEGSSSTNSILLESIRNWFWPPKEDTTKQEGNVNSNTLSNEQWKNYSKKSWLRKFARISQKRKHAPGGRARGARYRRFNRLRIRERVRTDRLSGLASEASDNSHGHEIPSTSMFLFHKDVNRSHRASKHSKPKDKSRKEHDILHAIKKSSEGYNSRRQSFLDRIKDSLRGAFGANQMSTTACEGGPSRPQKFSNLPPKSQRPVKTRAKSSETLARPTPISGISH